MSLTLKTPAFDILLMSSAIFVQFVVETLDVRWHGEHLLRGWYWANTDQQGGSAGPLHDFHGMG